MECDGFCHAIGARGCSTNTPTRIRRAVCIAVSRMPYICWISHSRRRIDWIECSSHRWNMQMAWINFATKSIRKPLTQIKQFVAMDAFCLRLALIVSVERDQVCMFFVNIRYNYMPGNNNSIHSSSSMGRVSGGSGCVCMWVYIEATIVTSYPRIQCSYSIMIL